MILTHNVGYFKKMEKRLLEEILKTSLKKNKKSILLLGPRQVGKSTLIQALNPDLKINLAEEKSYRDHLKDPDLISRQVLALQRGLIFIDEIQRIPSMINTLQMLIDEHKNYTFILTGSSARKIKKGQVNLLPGRVFSHSLFPMTYWELKDKFDLSRILRVGGLPEIYLQDYGNELLRDYVGAYMREEIQAEALVRSLDSFSRFLDIAAETSGQIINYTKLSTDSEIPKESLRRYFDILEDTLLIHRIPGFTEIKGTRKAMQKEKIMFFDIGVRNAILGRQNDQFSDIEMGHLFEQWFIQQIIAWNSYYKKDWKFFYYRDNFKDEVGLIIESRHKIFAIEIKSGKKIKSDFLKGLNNFAKYAKKPVHKFIVFQGQNKEKWDDVLAIPYKEFLDKIDDWLG